DGAHDVQFDENTELNHQPVRIIQWRQDAAPVLETMGLSNSSPAQSYIPVSAWINRTNDLVLQLRVDLSDWAKEIMGKRAGLPITGMVITESHSAIETSPS